jgi:hypothetical protein
LFFAWRECDASSLIESLARSGSENKAVSVPHARRFPGSIINFGSNSGPDANIVLKLPLFCRHLKTLGRSHVGRFRMSSLPLSQIIEIPDVSLNEKLIPANDNHEPTSLSIENLEAGSILAPRDYTKPSRSPLVIAAVFCLIVLAAFVVRLAI